MNDDGTISHFFPDQDSVDLYDVLCVKYSDDTSTIKKAYRRLALLHHPDKHTNSSNEVKADASLRFQQVGFAYAVLSDEKRRKHYDDTGKTDEGFELVAGDDGWEAYFEQMFERVTRGKLDDMKKGYQGSVEEIEDLQNAYGENNGSLEEIMKHIPHSTYEDEARFIIIITSLISEGKLELLPKWEASSKDEKSRLVRKKQGEKEAKEAERLAKELGVWDEFYGSGNAGARKGKGKGKEKKFTEEEEDEDVSALKSLILKKRGKNMDSFFDGLAAKYAEPAAGSKSNGKGKKRAKDDAEEDQLPKKKARAAVLPLPDIDDAEFEKLQQKLFSTNNAAKASDSNLAKKSRNKKSK